MKSPGHAPGAFLYGTARLKVGGGMEYALTNNWIIRGEYLYMQFENKTVFDLGDGSGGVPPATQPSPYTFHDHLHTARLGLAYKF